MFKALRFEGLSLRFEGLSLIFEALRFETLIFEVLSVRHL
jgi:hypothetical protein